MCHVTVSSSKPVIILLCVFYEKSLFVLLITFLFQTVFLCFIFFFCLLSVMTLPLEPGQLKLGFQLCPKFSVLDKDTRNVPILVMIAANLTGRERRGCSIILCRSMSSTWDPESLRHFGRAQIVCMSRSRFCFILHGAATVIWSVAISATLQWTAWL